MSKMFKVCFQTSRFVYVAQISKMFPKALGEITWLVRLMISSFNTSKKTLVTYKMTLKIALFLYVTIIII